jgi:putative acetyltransferase
VAKRYENMLDNIWVYEDVAIKGFVMIKGDEIVKLFVEPALQNNGTGAKLLEYAK